MLNMFAVRVRKGALLLGARLMLFGVLAGVTRGFAGMRAAVRLVRIRAPMRVAVGAVRGGHGYFSLSASRALAMPMPSMPRLM